jgi:prepilin-type N-terminal cleavage/methylation domain-containing protein
MKRLLALFSRTLPSTASTAGFTMIELLVVIAVIGVLAVAVLSSINPIEQINKGRDTRTRSDAAQLINAVDRYYAIHEVYPWNVDNATAGYTATDPLPDSEFNFVSGGGAGAWGWVDLLVDTGEVKAGFTNRLKSDDNLMIFKEGTTNATMYACFQPTSLAFKQEAMDNCNDGSTPVNGVDATFDPCPDDTAATMDGDNFICLP